MGNLGTRRRGFLRSHTATAPSTTTTDLILMELPAQDCPGAAEHDPATSPVTSERRRLVVPRIRPRRQRRTQGVQRPLQPMERIWWQGVHQPRLRRARVRQQGPGPHQSPREHPKRQTTPSQGVRRKNVCRPAEWQGVQPRLWPGPQLRQSGHPRQSRKQRRARGTDEWSPGT